MTHDLTPLQNLQRRLGEDSNPQNGIAPSGDTKLSINALPKVGRDVAPESERIQSSNEQGNSKVTASESPLPAPTQLPTAEASEVLAVPPGRPAGERIFHLLPPGEFLKSPAGEYRHHAPEAVKRFAAALNQCMSTRYGVSTELLARSPLEILRRTDLNLDRKDRLLALAIIRFAHLTEEGTEFLPGTKGPLYASMSTRMRWIANDTGKAPNS